ncbi:hypothetical protein [Microbulbifer variabilis]|uniref:Membrane fusion protein biotin-lipoyl like domain-containing protein n=1 Tax=Microbulbifer variabilis TaxID=266805 RepID=A0ABY4VAD4_9GAMM|nr:hypothetical protein [Microbulbifer variabilis]USD21243.1 hypothetical protein MJO52_19615 [Microbulbifer variabilis]
MRKICLFVVILAVSGITPLRAAEAPRFGEIAGLVSVERIYAQAMRTTQVHSLIGNWMEVFVRHGDAVEKGQLLAVYKSTRGRAVLEYIASRSGRVLINSRAALNTVESVLEIITVPHEEYCRHVDCTAATEE